MESDHDENASNYGGSSPKAASQFSSVEEQQPPEDSDEEIALCDRVERRDPTCRQRDWATAIGLRQPSMCMPTNRCLPELLRIPSHLLSTMDAYGKCWKPIEHDSDSLMVSETDGGSWVFCQGCVAEIPHDIQQMIYFFHMLQTGLQDFRNYAVPAQNISLKCKRDDTRVISDMFWHKSVDSVVRLAGNMEENDYIDMNECLMGLSQAETNCTSVSERLPPLKIRLGFTGVLYEYKGEKHRKLVAVLMVTWARNFDLLGYIQDNFLKEPCKKAVNARAKQHDVQVFAGIWKMIRRKVAYMQLGLEESRFGLPDDYSDNRGGEMGIDALHNMFQIPYHCLGIIRNDIFEQERRTNTHLKRSSIQVEKLRIIGLPCVRYNLNEETTQQFLHFMRAYTLKCSNDYIDLNKAIKEFYKPKDKKKGNEEEGAVDQNVDRSFTLSSPGGWPLEVKHEDNGDIEVTRFGAPPLPIWHLFSPETTPEVGTNFENWLVDIGGANGLPELTKTCLRSFCTQDFSQSRAEVMKMWEVFLKDQRLADPALTYEKYYSASADPLASLVTENYLRSWWVSMSKNISSLRECGSSVQEASKGLSRYLLSSFLYHKNSIHSGVVRSDRLMQAVQIMEKTDFRNVCRRNPDSILKMITRLSQNMSADRKFDMYQRTNEAFWKSFEVTNQFFLMNSSNLEMMVETMVSQIMWMMSSQNPNIVGYFQPIVQTSGNGHYNISTKEGVLPDRRKPNSTGADFTREKICELFQMQLDRAGISDVRENLQGPRLIAGWTAASLGLATHASIMGGRVNSMPEKAVSYSDIAITEMRGQNMPMSGLIKDVVVRNEGGANNSITLSTADPDKSNERKVQTRFRVNKMQLVSLASNVPDANKEAAEGSKTLSTVTHVMVPGSEHYHKRQKIGPINNLTSSNTIGRQIRPENTEGIVNMLPFSHMWACVIPALMNQFGVMPMHISQTTLALLDWIILLVKESSDGIMSKDTMESFQRMKNGYEARQATKALWTKSIMYLATCETEEDALNAVMQTSYANVMPIHDAVCTAHSFMTRSIHMGALIMVACITAHLEVPIIPLENLKHFFNTTEVPTSGEAKSTYDSIKAWIVQCVQKNRFCPDNNTPFCAQDNISPYVTSNATVDNQPDTDAILRVKRLAQAVKFGEPQDGIHHAIAHRIKDVFGPQLVNAAHMGPEVSIYWNALWDLMHNFNPDFRQLISNKVFASRQHLEKLGILRDVPGIVDWPHDAEKPPPFARSFTFAQPCADPSSYAIGVHWAALLLCVSFSEDAVIHPKISSNFARNILKEILKHSPPSATPGNNLLLRSFNLNSRTTERIILSSTIKRPHHFLRPLHDAQFADSGTYNLTRAIGRFAPEDCLHCGCLFKFAELYNCDILELPGKAIFAEYELMPNTSYTIYRCSDKREGTILLNSRRGKAVITHMVRDDESAETLDVDPAEWVRALKEQDFIITPVIFRQGACVSVLDKEEDITDIGCLIPFPSGQMLEGCYYHMMLKGNEEIIHFMDVLANVVPLGQLVFLNLDASETRDLKLPLFEKDKRKHWIAMRVNVPTVAEPPAGRIYLTCVRRSIIGNTHLPKIMVYNVDVDPVNVKLILGAEEEYATELYLS